MSTDRRTFLKLLGMPALAAAMPTNIARLMASSINNRTGSLADVEHIIILTQENRSFDHYFGTMRGVRGFADPRAVALPSGQPVWQQPNGTGYVLPFRPAVANLGNTYLPDVPHGWTDGHLAWNGGKYDGWIRNKGITTMTHHVRADIPYHFALADAFTICDAYHCSVMGPTDPNRYHLWTGWLGNDGKTGSGGPVITNAEAGYDWSTYPERLERAGVTWKVYQDVGVGLDAAGFWGWTGDDAFIGNYGDNSLLYFHQYQNAPDGSALANRARTGTNILSQRTHPTALMDILREDVKRGRLPQVSWIVAPEAYSEHPNWPPNFGAWYMSQIVDILADNPEVWAKTAFFINWDEDGGFFDHMVAPTPASSAEFGKSTVSVENEIFYADFDYPDGVRYPSTAFPSGPYGLGIRVPLIVVSPWTRGGWVNSQVFDHTSLIRFIERRFAHGNNGLVERNITPWRRAVVGDLTSVFDFEEPESWRRKTLPSTAADMPTDFTPHASETIAVPAVQTTPRQEHGVRPARALPYDLHARGAVVDENTFRIDFENTGTAAAVFQVRSRSGADMPRTYTVEARKHLFDIWHVGPDGTYNLSVTGPNGFLRSFAGSAAGVRVAVVTSGVRSDHWSRDDADDQGSPRDIELTFANDGPGAVALIVFDRYAHETFRERLSAGGSLSKRWNLSRYSGWYEFRVNVAEDAQFDYRLAGHVENGEDSISDPLMGGLL